MLFHGLSVPKRSESKLMHHVYMDMNDEDFSEEHEELVSLLALLKDGKGKLSEVMP